MREVAFIKQNKEKWLDFEKAIYDNQRKDPDELASLYIHLVNDLSYAQTYYPKSVVRKYLNQLASKAFQKIYKTKRADTNRFVHFFRTEVPLLMRQYRRYVLYAFLLFATFVAIGVFSAWKDDTFARVVLGDEYVNMTLQNIDNGDPVAVYKSGSNWGSFVGITLNNLYIGIKSFIYGIFLGFGTGMVLFYNGIMLGSFQYFFWEQGVFWESVHGIWIHGAMEIFAIIIEAAAGLILGASILFPRTYSRIDSFKIGVKDGVKILISTFPFTFSAGFLEGFVTRYSNAMPNWLPVGIILLTSSFITFYYLVYPHLVYRKMKRAHGTV